MFGKLKKKQAVAPVELPPIMQPEDPVNYDTVLDWLLGLSDKDYKVMLEVVGVYRDANKTSAKLLKIKDQPTSTLMPTKQPEEEVDNDLDLLLETDPAELKSALLADEPEAPKKPTNKKITVSDK